MRTVSRRPIVPELDLESPSGDLTTISSTFMSEKLTPKTRSSLFTLILVIVWYVSAIFAISTSKYTMMQLPLPFLLCTSQFTVATLLTQLYLHFTNSNKPLLPSISFLVYQISISYTLGFIFTNVAFSIVSASFAETIKAAEPISSVIIGIFYLNEGATTITYLTLLPICLGVAISSFHDASFNIWGFLSAATSNLCFSSRAVLAKVLNQTHPGALDETQLFFHLSRVGLVLLVPCTLILEGRPLLSLVNLHPSPSIPPSISLPQNFSFWKFSLLLLCNGLAYTTYNLASFLVLSRTSLVSHAVLNVMRRVFIILTTSVLFAAPLSLLNLLGVCLAICGVGAFALSRSRDNRLAQNKQ